MCFKAFNTKAFKRTCIQLERMQHIIGNLGSFGARIVLNIPVGMLRLQSRSTRLCNP